MAVNTWAVSIMRYGAGIPKCNTDERKTLRKKGHKFYDNAWSTTSEK